MNQILVGSNNKKPNMLSIDKDLLYTSTPAKPFRPSLEVIREESDADDESSDGLLSVGHAINFPAVDGDWSAEDIMEESFSTSDAHTQFTNEDLEFGSLHPAQDFMPGRAADGIPQRCLSRDSTSNVWLGACCLDTTSESGESAEEDLKLGRIPGKMIY